MKMRNPWASAKVGGREDAPPDRPVQQTNRFAAPAGDAPYLDALGWGPSLIARGSAVETPSAQRIGSIPRADFRPIPQRPPEEFWDTIDRDDARRHSVESVTGNGWTEQKGSKRWAPNPRETPPPEPRVTSQLAPRSYSFTRPFDQHARRLFNGMHFSMADHRRTYPIYGMRPPMTPRNTYRIEPTPWDENIVDLPPDYGIASQRLRSVDVPSPSRSFRLGG